MRRILTGCSWLTIFIALAVTLPRYLSRLAVSLNSDHLILPDLYEGLFQRGESWGSWRFAGASYLFPDTVAFFALAAVLKDTWLTYFVLTGIFITLMLMGFLLLTRARTGQRRAGTTAGVLALFILVTHGGTALPVADFWWSLYQPYVHAGAYLLVLAAMLLTLVHLKHRHRWSLLLLAVVTLLGTLSDLLFVLYFTVPSALTGMFLAWRQPGSRPALRALGLAVLLATLGGRWLLPLLTEGQGSESLYLSQIGIGTAWSTTAFMVRDLVARDHRIFALNALAGLVAAGVLAGRTWSMATGRRPFFTRAWYLDSSAFWALTGGWAALLATGNYVDPASWRYVMFPTALAVATAVGALILHLPRWAGRAALASVALFCLAHGFTRPVIDRPYPGLARWLDAYNPARPPLVLADYWHARLTTFQSRTGLRVEQIAADGRRYHWVNSLESYRRLTPDADRHTLVVLDGLDLERIRSAYGPPEDEIKVENHHLYIYGPDASPRIILHLQKDLPAP
jgi:hypothetical protein